MGRVKVAPVFWMFRVCRVKRMRVLRSDARVCVYLSLHFCSASSARTFRWISLSPR